MTSNPPAEDIRTLHDGTVEVALPAEARSVTLARHFLAERWSYLAGGVLDDIELIVTELVANAVEHGRPEISLRLREMPFAIDIAVLDHGTGLPRRKTADEVDGQGSGRGLAIVETLAAAWGVEPLSEEGKIVWVTVARA